MSEADRIVLAACTTLAHVAHYDMGFVHRARQIFEFCRFYSCNSVQAGVKKRCWVSKNVHGEQMSAKVICRLARKRLDLTQERLGELLGLNHSTVSRAEANNGKDPSPDYIRFCELVVKLTEPGPNSDFVSVDVGEIVSALSRVPLEKRASGGPAFTLLGLCLDKGRVDVFEKMTGRKASPIRLVDNEFQQNENFMQSLANHIEDIKDQLRDYSMESSSKAAQERFERGILLLAQFSECVRLGTEIERRDASKSN